MTTRAEFITSLQAQYGVDPEAAARAADRAGYRDTPIGKHIDEGALEKAVEHEGDRRMLALGFEVIRFSHPGRTKQTPGIADRRYYHRRRGLALWWEAKSATGTQRPDQRAFQELVEACGETYVLGTHEELCQWLCDHGVAERGADGLVVPLPLDRQVSLPLSPFEV